MIRPPAAETAMSAAVAEETEASSAAMADVMNISSVVAVLKEAMAVTHDSQVGRVTRRWNT